MRFQSTRAPALSASAASPAFVGENPTIAMADCTSATMKAAKAVSTSSGARSTILCCTYHRYTVLASPRYPIRVLASEGLLVLPVNLMLRLRRHALIVFSGLIVVSAADVYAQELDQLLANIPNTIADGTTRYNEPQALTVSNKALPLNSCTVRPSRVYMGAIIGASDLASADNVRNLQASQNTSFYLTSYALTQVASLRLSAILANWSSQAKGIIEVGTDPVVMPDIASTYGSYVTTLQHWTWGGVKGSTWPSLIAAGGWSPKIAMLNPFGMGMTDNLSDPYYLMNLAAIADVKRAGPSIQYVLPYLTANGAQVSTTNNDNDWTSAYWGESRALVTAAGGVGLDTPANYFMYVREPAYRRLSAQEIKWATTNGLISVVLLSPYDLTAATGTTPQFHYDPTFMQAVQAEVSYLHSQGADPTFYVVANYSEGAGTNAPGSDTDPSGETVDAVALWVVRNASTSPVPAGSKQQACGRRPQGQRQHPDRGKAYQRH